MRFAREKIRDAERDKLKAQHWGKRMLADRHSAVNRLKDEAK